MEMELQTITQDLNRPGDKGIEDSFETAPSFMKSKAEGLPVEIINNLSPAGLGRLYINPKNTSPFIEANCESVSINHLRDECVTPVFTKCNSVTISHYDFIEATDDCVSDFYKGETILTPEIRVSHKILGRIQEALKKPKSELLPHEETIFWERAAFAIEIPSITMEIGGNTLSLVVGGVRTFNNQNLYSKKTVERFKVFTGFINQICTNCCVSTNGLLVDIRVVSVEELKSQIFQLLNSYDMNSHVRVMKNLENQHLSQSQFCQLIGRIRLYQHLPKETKLTIPELLFTDSQINAIVKAYMEDDNFKGKNNGDINLWKMYNLFTGANKSSYIDSFLERSENAFNFIYGISKAIDGDKTYRWFLS
ncbi:DUF3871 family protein [Flavobacterium sp.]|uniref:DUF3871 family protein n=1 Tax=Flavobacterium sp. TaxID=239 RepID=UPI002B4AEDAF|nr:DUF3871 family protein [Flavobacterium sp.]HLF52572.1 DUF3871 family protein [Flavobacterium sp.]